MSFYTLSTESALATEAAGFALAHLLEAGDVLVLSGDLGAGKTRLTKGIALGLGVVEPVTSPTFNILLVHSGRLPLYHFDLYRLDEARQLDDVDYWATLEADGVSVVEWGDRFGEAVPDGSLTVRLLMTGDETRSFELEAGGGSRGESLGSQWAEACRAVDGVVVSGGEPQ